MTDIIFKYIRSVIYMFVKFRLSNVSMTLSAVSLNNLAVKNLPFHDTEAAIGKEANLWKSQG